MATTNLHRVRSLWTGFPGAPGYTTLYFDASTSPPNTAAVRAWFQAMVGILPNNVTIQVPGAGDTVGTANGVISGSWATAVPAAVVGGGGTVYSAPSGLICNLNTSSVFGSRRVRGRAFIVPIVGTAYDSTGTINNTNLTTVQTGNNTFLAAVGSTLQVWHRPVALVGGASFDVTSIVTPDKSCILRSRRD